MIGERKVFRFRRCLEIQEMEIDSTATNFLYIFRQVIGFPGKERHQIFSTLLGCSEGTLMIVMC